ncbi:hypothetical protein QWZ13_07510 [Reinekea marina]|uniref:hypothetical protein n=1 Tax=Reinekea marina TaxID=1310421 RepID=UPI0025B5B485|nr:hypothetical protein [Reinekea marina]MDN3648756.1 hypothetical protein [Reinekea marina]
MHDGSSCWMPYLIRVLQLNHGTSGTGPSHFLRNIGYESGNLLSLEGVGGLSGYLSHGWRS